MNTSKYLPVTLTVLSLSAVCGTAMAENYPKEMEEDLISVCRNAAEDDRMGLRKAVKDFAPTTKITQKAYRVLANGLVCNGMGLTAFARYHGATETYNVLKQYTYPNVIIEIKEMTISRAVPEDITVAMSPGK
ncbi:DUF3718 domain-containing protein [Alteromonas lipolytica]|uniref:DUF3718 domain-containing protein n=1 Tax=Alteromonas lipolytica TaxID=1856405 RepID=A0A1E8FHJ1_9ALTE|nr:DUF3718 domain-containing protein [Alteromonas lipolytica]OFI34933.1 hypothetical protein BFC17_15315 [Alteromonas lipolytica]GGF55209.1 hypothetical protein GCM10011338_04310 [Alteromonas lipolytica]